MRYLLLPANEEWLYLPFNMNRVFFYISCTPAWPIPPLLWWKWMSPRGNRQSEDGKFEVRKNTQHWPLLASLISHLRLFLWRVWDTVCCYRRYQLCRCGNGGGADRRRRQTVRRLLAGLAAAAPPPPVMQRDEKNVQSRSFSWGGGGGGGDWLIDWFLMFNGETTTNGHIRVTKSRVTNRTRSYVHCENSLHQTQPSQNSQHFVARE